MSSSSSAASAPAAVVREHQQLADAAGAGDLPLVIKLVESGVPVDCKNAGLQTPLMCAASNDRASEVVRYLLLHGADVNASATDTNMTPLLYAAWRDCPANMRILLRAGASPAARDVIGRTVLHWAALSCSVDTLRPLLRAGCGTMIDTCDSSGYTALMIAAEHGRQEVVELLLSHRASPILKNRLSHTSVELADWFGHRKIVEVLETSSKRYAPAVEARMEGLSVSGEKAAVPATTALMGVSAAVASSIATLPR